MKFIYYDALLGEIVEIEENEYIQRVQKLYGKTINPMFKLTDEIGLYYKKLAIYTLLTNEEKQLVDEHMQTLFYPAYVILKMPIFEDKAYNKTYFELLDCIYPLAVYNYDRSFKIFLAINNLIKPAIDDILFFLNTLVYKLFDNKHNHAAIRYGLLLFDTAKQNPKAAKIYSSTFVTLCNKLKVDYPNHAIEIADFCLKNNFPDSTKSGWQGRLDKLKSKQN